jgi:hypothetical protein
MRKLPNAWFSGWRMTIEPVVFEDGVVPLGYALFRFALQFVWMKLADG